MIIHAFDVNEQQIHIRKDTYMGESHWVSFAYANGKFVGDFKAPTAEGAAQLAEKAIEQFLLNLK